MDYLDSRSKAENFGYWTGNWAANCKSFLLSSRLGSRKLTYSCAYHCLSIDLSKNFSLVSATAVPHLSTFRFESRFCDFHSTQSRYLHPLDLPAKRQSLWIEGNRMNGFLCLAPRAAQHFGNWAGTLFQCTGRLFEQWMCLYVFDLFFMILQHTIWGALEMNIRAIRSTFDQAKKS